MRLARRPTVYTALALSAAVIALLAPAGAAAPGASHCPRYTPGRPSAGARCLSMPWVLVQTGPGARSLEISFAPGCFPNPPRVHVRETRRAITIQVIAPGERPDLNCVESRPVALAHPVDGRRILIPRWIAPPHRGLFAGQLIGVPRLLGLAPAQAARVLWLDGFAARVVGHGRQVVGQIPGWALTTPATQHPHLVTLMAGPTIVTPPVPAPPEGMASGWLVGAVRFVGGPFVQVRPPIAGVVDLFDAAGRLVGEFRARAGRSFRLRLAPGVYLLESASGGLDDCGAARAIVRAARTAHVTVPTGCDVP